MLKSIKRFAEICSQTLPVFEPIYEFGALQVEGQEGFADLRSFFPGKSYIGTDFREGPGVDVITGEEKSKLLKSFVDYESVDYGI